MSWIGERVHDPGLLDAYVEVADLASWSDWAPLVEAVPWAPREPGVFLLREPATQQVVHVGMAGERAGGGGRPQGLYGRLTELCSGHAAVGGFAEAALDRALADPDWVSAQVQAGPRRARRWAADAIRRLEPDVSWAERPERADAKLLADRVELLLRPHGLWHR